eukprot:2308073-Pyramimonas_sp.AAC.1
MSSVCGPPVWLEYSSRKGYWPSASLDPAAAGRPKLRRYTSSRGFLWSRSSGRLADMSDSPTRCRVESSRNWRI